MNCAFEFSLIPEPDPKARRSHFFFRLLFGVRLQVSNKPQEDGLYVALVRYKYPMFYLRVHNDELGVFCEPIFAKKQIHRPTDHSKAHLPTTLLIRFVHRIKSVL